jgi:glucose-1-phosphate thymidylyltransferase
MKALVLAAGYATRLYPLTLDRPKALLEVGGRPMLDHVLERLEEMGVDETIVVTNAKFTPHFQEWASGRDGVRIVNDGTTSNDDRLGAIGDIGFVLDQTGLEDDLVVVAGDNLFGEDLSGFPAYGGEVDAPVLAVHDVGDLSLMREYNQVDVDDEGRIVFFEEKPEEARSTLAGVALYFYPQHSLPLIREYLNGGNNPDQPGRLIEWLYPRTSVYTWRLPGRWYDIGSAETLAEADRIFSQSRNT